jgi:hypothetical protein
MITHDGGLLCFAKSAALWRIATWTAAFARLNHGPPVMIHLSRETAGSFHPTPNFPQKFRSDEHQRVDGHIDRLAGARRYRDVRAYFAFTLI